MGVLLGPIGRQPLKEMPIGHDNLDLESEKVFFQSRFGWWSESESWHSACNASLQCKREEKKQSQTLTAVSFFWGMSR
jgi:hypothetical protein